VAFVSFDEKGRRKFEIFRGEGHMWMATEIDTASSEEL
jgi:hypothetical protein